MITKHTNIKKPLLDGSESEIRSTPINLGSFVDGADDLQLEDLVTNNLEALKNIIDEADYNSIMASGDFNNDEGFLNLPKGSDGLRTYYYQNGNTIFVFAYGEFQPGRYKLYLEGTWEIN